jgi:histone-lysine N-methyltransferase SETMAR
VASKFEKHHVSRLSHPSYSPDISPCDFWLFGILKGVLKDREPNSSNEIEEAIVRVWVELIFDEVQSVFHNWMNRLAWTIENGGEYIPGGQ